ncbi:MAG: AMP-binding protein [Desulfobacterales bacterium]|jgi:long-chain acyl-CoA synthetase
MNIAKNLEQSAFYFPNRPAISENVGEISYAYLNEQSNRIATALLKLGVAPGDHISLCAPNSANWVAFYFGVLKTGAVAVTLSSLLKRQELEMLTGHCRPKLIFTFAGLLEDASSIRDKVGIEKIICDKGDLSFEQLLKLGKATFKAIDRDRSDTAVILYTGGTTGIPKGVELTHENIAQSIQNVIFNERSNEKDMALLFLPFNHVFGQMHIMNATILSAGCLKMIPTFDMEVVLDILKKGRVTKFYAVPTIYARFLELENLKEKLGSVRYCFSAASSMAAEHVRQWKERTGMPIHESYGMTEAAPMVTYNHYYRHVIGSVGTPVSGVEVQIRDIQGNLKASGETGEICIRGRNIMKGYLNNPQGNAEAFWEGGWFRSGDIGVIDANGYLFIVDRIKDMIITGGENVYPREVEEILYAQSDISECAVIGLPDSKWGEKVTAVIVTKTGQPFDSAEIKRNLKLHLSAFKVPKEYRFVSELPKSPTGKILKRVLKQSLIDK